MYAWLRPASRQVSCSGLCSRRIAARGPLDVSLLTKLQVLGSVDQGSNAGWTLVNKASEALSLQLKPRMSCGDFGVLRTAALAGMGVACSQDVPAGGIWPTVGWCGGRSIGRVSKASSIWCSPPVAAGHRPRAPSSTISPKPSTAPHSWVIGPASIG